MCGGLDPEQPSHTSEMFEDTKFIEILVEIDRGKLDRKRGSPVNNYVVYC